MTFMEKTKHKISINIISNTQRNKQIKKEQFIKQIKKNCIPPKLNKKSSMKLSVVPAKT